MISTGKCKEEVKWAKIDGFPRRPHEEEDAGVCPDEDDADTGDDDAGGSALVVVSVNGVVTKVLGVTTAPLVTMGDIRPAAAGEGS